MTPMNGFIEPQEVAAAMLFLCSADASAMTGQAINVTGEIHHDSIRSFARRLAPTSLRKGGRQKDRICTS